MQVIPAPFPSMGFDSVTAMDAVRAPALKAAGLNFSVRYLGSVTPAEVQIILDAGLLFSPVTYSRSPGWLPTSEMGISDGAQDVAHLQALGLPQGCTVWIDLEGVSLTATLQDLTDWINNRSLAIKNAGFDVGLYVGASDILDSAQLYALPYINRYWRSLSEVPSPTCGFAMMQLYKSVIIANTLVDVDVIQYDFQDRLPLMVSA